MTKRSFILYSNNKDLIDSLTDEQAGKLFKAIFQYETTGQVSELDPVVNIAFLAIKKELDETAKSYEEKCRKNREAGKQGGRPPKQEEQKNQTVLEKANGFLENRTVSEKSERLNKNPNDNDNDTDTDTDTKNDNDLKKKDTPIGVSQKENAPKSNRFKPPTVDEVKAYCQSRGNCIDPGHFVDFYEAKGWFLGKNKMKDWKASVRTWERNSNGGVRDGTHNPDKPVKGQDFW